MLFSQLAAFTLAAVLPAQSPEPSAAPARLRNHFDADAPMRPPAFFDFVVLGAPGDAQWKVLVDFNPPSAPNQVTQTFPERPRDSIAAALRRNANFRDGKVSVGLRNGTGQGGLVLRMTGEKDFLLLLVDHENGEARLSSYARGKATELARSRVKPDRAWSILSIELSGPRVLARWDGEPLLEASDPQPSAGRVGLASAGPGLAAFDELVIEPADSPETP